MSAGGSDTTFLGILAILIGMAAISVNDMLVKYLSTTYPLHQIVLLRSVGGLAITIAILHFEGGWRQLRTQWLRIHLLRGTLVVAANALFFTAIVTLPLAEASALFFVAPLFATVLSIPMLGEKVGWPRWSAVFVGLIGVIIMIRPGSDLFTPIALLPIAAAFFYASVNLLTRYVGQADKASVMAFYIQLMFAVFSILFGLVLGDGRYAPDDNPNLAFLLGAWSWPAPGDWVLFGVCGLAAGFIGYCLSQAYRLAAASLIAPFEYSLLPFAVFWGWLIWGHLPDAQGTLGIGFIIAAGVLIGWREAAQRRKPQPVRRA